MAAAIQVGATVTNRCIFILQVNLDLMRVLAPTFIMVILVRIKARMPLPSCVAELRPSTLSKPHEEEL